MLLLHGMSTSGDSFRELMHLLAADYQLIAPDIPGFGYSDHTTPYVLPHLIEWLAAFIAGLNLRRVSVVGHSFGGVLATGHALAYPEHVERLVLLAPALLTAAQYPDWLRGLINPGLVDWVTEAGMAVARYAAPELQVRAPFHNPGQINTNVWRRRADDYANARASGRVMSAVLTYDLTDRLEQLRPPVCLIWGQEDRVVNPAHAAELASRLPDVRGVHLLPGCGHVPAIESRDSVAAIVRQFVPAG